MNIKKRIKKIIVPVVLLLFVFNTNTVKSQEIKFKSLYLYNFTKYVGWPIESKTGDFVIGILGSNAIYNMVNQIATGKMVGSQKIVVKKFGKSEELTDCHILFVSYGNAGKSSMETIMGSVGNKSTLIVAERDGAVKSGAAINFVIRNEEMKFELSKNNAMNKKLQISSNLEKLAILVD